MNVHCCLDRLARLCTALALLAGLSATATELRPFDAGSLDAIRAAHAGKPFVLAFWSVYCEPCRDEMPDWGSLQAKYPRVPILLVATDPPGDRAAVEQMLSRHPLGQVETWTFADDFAERVRFAIDRRWRGELPRSYFFDARHRAVARSGRLDKPWTRRWLAQQTARKQ
jgi:thiol-disulfide isomerase/thioredoxin